MTAFMFTTYHRSRIDYEYRFAEYDYGTQVHQ